MKKLIYIIFVIFLFSSCGPKQEKVEKIMVDGESHIKNPKKPLKGEVLLDIEQSLKINPYLYEEVDLGGFYFVRDTDGEVILFNPTKTEAQRFNQDGRFVYIIKPPQGVSLETVKFYSFGFAARETQEDELLVYTGYTIKNLPDIFKINYKCPASLV